MFFKLYFLKILRLFSFNKYILKSFRTSKVTLDLNLNIDNFFIIRSRFLLFISIRILSSYILRIKSDKNFPWGVV